MAFRILQWLIVLICKKNFQIFLCLSKITYYRNRKNLTWTSHLMEENPTKLYHSFHRQLFKSVSYKDAFLKITGSEYRLLVNVLYLYNYGIGFKIFQLYSWNFQKEVKIIKGTVSRDFLLQVFSWIIFPKPLKIRVISFFSEICGDIRKSRWISGINDRDGDTSIKFAISVNYTGSKFATGINDTGGKFCHRYRWCHWYRWQICHRCQQYRRQICHQYQRHQR